MMQVPFMSGHAKQQSEMASSVDQPQICQPSKNDIQFSGRSVAALAGGVVFGLAGMLLEIGVACYQTPLWQRVYPQGSYEDMSIEREKALCLGMTRITIATIVGVCVGYIFFAQSLSGRNDLALSDDQQDADPLPELGPKDESEDAMPPLEDEVTMPPLEGEETMPPTVGTVEGGQEGLSNSKSPDIKNQSSQGASERQVLSSKIDDESVGTDFSHDSGNSEEEFKEKDKNVQFSLSFVLVCRRGEHHTIHPNGEHD